jgi:hypothetical protein
MPNETTSSEHNITVVNGGTFDPVLMVDSVHDVTAGGTADVLTIEFVQDITAQETADILTVHFVPDVTSDVDESGEGTPTNDVTHPHLSDNVVPFRRRVVTSKP